MKKILSGIVLFFALCSAATAFAGNETVDKGLDAFFKNDRAAARTSFMQAFSSADTKADAALCLALLSWEEGKNGEATEYFNQFMAASPNPYPYVYALWQTRVVIGSYGKLPKEKISMLNKMLLDKNANSTIKALVHAALGYHWEMSNMVPKSTPEFAKIGGIKEWAITGPFDNASGSGFLKNYDPISKPEQTAHFTSKNNVDISWFKVNYTRADGYFRFDHHLISGNSILYAQTFVSSPEDRDVQIRCGYSGSIRIWLNDKEIVTDDDERDPELDYYTVNVKLHKGYNRILVQSGESTHDQTSFVLRITDPNGNLYTDLNATDAYQAYPKSDDVFTIVKPFAQEYFLQQTAQNPGNKLLSLMLFETYLHDGMHLLAHQQMDNLRKDYPNSSYLSERMIQVYSLENNSLAITKEHESMKKNDPDNLSSIFMLCSEAIEKDDYTELERLNNRIVSLYGESEMTIYYDVIVLSKQNNSDALINKVNYGYRKYPDDYGLMVMKYTLEQNISKDLAKSSKVLKTYLKTNLDDNVITSLASNYYQIGKPADALKIYKTRIANYPYYIRGYSDLAEQYFSVQDYANAEVWRKKALEFAPYSGVQWNELGQVYQSSGRKAEAKSAYEKSLSFNRNDYDARRQLRTLNNQKPLFELMPQSDAYELFRNSPKATDYPNDNSIILLNDRQMIVHPEGATEERDEILVKVFSQAGIDGWKEYYINYNEYNQNIVIEKMEILKADGNRLQAENNGNHLVFSSLEAGDAIHITYRIENYLYGKLAREFWEKFYFNNWYPVQVARFSILLPSDHKFDYVVNGAEIKPTVTDAESNKIYSWEMKNMPSVKSEDYMPSFADIGITLDITSIPDWSFVASWYSDLSTSKSKSEFEVKETVASLFKDKTNLSELQKAKIIYEYIEKNMTYSNVSFLHSAYTPQRASRTINTKQGDCKDFATLFVSMAQEVGLKANLVLVDTRENGDKDLVLPSLNFNHCIAQVQADGKNYFVELTDQKLPFGCSSNNLTGSLSLKIPREGAAHSGAPKLEPLMPQTSTANTITRKSKVSFTGNDMQIDRETIRTGALTSKSRYDFADIGKEEQLKQMTQAVSSEFTNPVKMTELSFTNLDNLSDTVRYHYVFSTKNVFSEVAGLKIMRIPWTDSYSSIDFLSLEKRKYPFSVWMLASSETLKEEITIDIPKGKTLAEMPKPVKLTHPAVEYTLTYKNTGTQIIATREIRFKADYVKAEDYQAFKDFFIQISENDAKQIGFK